MSLVYYALPFVGLGAIVLLIYQLSFKSLHVQCKECTHDNGKRMVFCRNCGANVTTQHDYYEGRIFDRTTVILAFFVPVIAWYLLLNFRDIYPERARFLWTASLVGSVIFGFNVWGGLVFGYYGLFYLY